MHIATEMKIHSLTYPIDEAVPDLLRAFESSNTVILSAPPGAGKTTRVPITFLNHGNLNNKKILMLEPRRLAARRAAEYMSAQLSEHSGETIGYRIRGDSKCGPGTKIEILTEGILTRMLQREPDLPNVGMIIFDEFHERSIHADLGLAFSIDVQRHLRNDLRILIMSATMDGIRLADILGDVPLVESKGKLFPIDTRFARFKSEKPLEVKVADVVERAIENDEGDILVFLPGWREIQRSEQALFRRRLSHEVIFHTLHGEASFASQSAALAPDPLGRRKVILSTNVAETSLTIEGVRVVVDSGLVRVARFDSRRGMSGLVTVPVSRASADQRRGRAGRLAPGTCYRLWTESEHAQRPEFAQPEIRSTDLAPLALDLARWGSPNGENLVFLDPPPAANLRQAQEILRDLEAVDDNGRLTTVGLAMADLPVHPRLAHMILQAKPLGLGGMACDLAALLDDRDLFTGQKDADVDLTTRWHELHKAKAAIHDRIASQARRFRNIADIDEGRSDGSEIGLLLAFAYPDRVAKRRDKSGTTYLTTSGTTAALPPGSTLSRHEYLVIADADRAGTGVRIFLCAPITKQELIDSFASKINVDDFIQWNVANQSVVAKRVTRLGAVILSDQPITSDDDRIHSAMIDGIRELGFHALPWDTESQTFRERSEWLRTRKLVDDDWPDLSEARLMESLDRWLKPFLPGIRQRDQLSKLDLRSALGTLFSHSQFKNLEILAPQRLRLPSGSSATIDYSSGNNPVLAVRLQELFGQVETPRVGLGAIPVVIHLLSPAKRPIAVTQDLSSFWKTVYPEIRNQLHAKYPKHVWPEDPLRATPTSRTKKQ